MDPDVWEWFQGQCQSEEDPEAEVYGKASNLFRRSTRLLMTWTECFNEGVDLEETISKCREIVDAR